MYKCAQGDRVSAHQQENQPHHQQLAQQTEIQPLIQSSLPNTEVNAHFTQIWDQRPKREDMLLQCRQLDPFLDSFDLYDIDFTPYEDGFSMFKDWCP
jgi:hypothetical protein